MYWIDSLSYLWGWLIVEHIPFLSFKRRVPKYQDTSLSAAPAWIQKPLTLVAWQVQSPSAKRDAKNYHNARHFVCTGLLVQFTALCLNTSVITRVQQIAQIGDACSLTASRG